MVVAAGVARDLRAFHAAGTRRKVEVVHGHENSPLRRLEAVPYVWQRSADNHAHGVCQVAVFEFLLDRQFDQPTAHVVAEHAVAGCAISFRGIR